MVVMIYNVYNLNPGTGRWPDRPQFASEWEKSKPMTPLVCPLLCSKHSLQSESLKREL